MKQPVLSGIEKVIRNDYCIGCGACVGISEGSLDMRFDPHGMFKAFPVSEEAGIRNADEASVVCPFADDGPDEDEIGGERFASDATSHDGRLGYFRLLAAGHVKPGNYREIATSGGLVTWTLCRLLETGAVDYVVHVRERPRGEDGKLFEFDVSESVEAVRQGAKSRYYPVEMSVVLDRIRRVPGRYAVVGVPCFIKAVRRLSKVDPRIKDRVPHTIALICGHLKSRAFADYFGWQSGIEPGALERIDFRVKQDEGRAGDYCVSVEGDGVETTRLARSYFGSNWGYNFFRYKACDFCDDVFGECADLTVGDAWIPPYIQDPKGNSVVVARSEEMERLIREGINDGALRLDPISVDLAVRSQAGGLRDRREGLAFRLHEVMKRGVDWVPRKRVTPTAEGLPIGRRVIYRARMRLRAMSHEAWIDAVDSGDFARFQKAMSPLIRRVKVGYLLSWRGFWLTVKSPLRGLKRWVRRIPRRPGTGGPGA